MGELSEVSVPASSPACYTIEDDDEPEVIFIADNNSSEEDSRDGEPSSTTSDINGDEAQGDSTVEKDEYIDADADTQQNTIESSDSSDEDECSGNVLNDFIKLIDVVNSYKKHDSTVKTKFKDGFVFLENLQTQFEETARNVTEKNEMIAGLIAENIKLKGDNKQLKGEINTQSLQFGMLKSKYVKLKEEMENLKMSEKMAEEPPVRVPVPTNLVLETMKSKADKLQQLFKQLCNKTKEERVYISDPESVKRSKELKSFQNEVGVLLVKVQHKLSKWSKNQVKLEDELECCRMSLEQLHGMVTSGPQMEVVTPPTTAPVVQSSVSQLACKKRKLPPPPLVPLNTSSASKCNSDTPVTPFVQEQNTTTLASELNAAPKPSSHSPALESNSYFDENSTTQSMEMIHVPFVMQPLQVSVPPTLHMPPSPPPEVPIKLSPSIVSTSSPTFPEIKNNDTSPISPPQLSPSWYELPPLPHLNFPLSPLKPIISIPKPETLTSSSEQVQTPLCNVPSVSSKAEATQVHPPVKKRRRRRAAKTQMTPEKPIYPFPPPQYSQAPYPTHPQYNPYPVSQYTPNESLQAILQAYQNQTMQLSTSTASQFPPQQQHQISSSAPPVSTQSSISSVSITETQKQTNVTLQNKCQVCAMTFLTIVQLKLHHAVVHSNKTPSSEFTGPAATSPPTSTDQQIISRPPIVLSPTLQDLHQNAVSLQSVTSIGEATVSTNTTMGTSTTTTWSNEPNQKRHCSGLFPLASELPTSSISNTSHVAPVPINNNCVNNSFNSTLPNDTNNLFSFLDLL